MGQSKSTHGPLRRIYRILSETHSNPSDNLKMLLVVKPLKDTARPKGLVPSLLLFGAIPSLGNGAANLTEQEERFRAVYTVRREAAKVIAEQRINISFRTNVPPSVKP